MDIYENTTICIACPANYASGGPELLHQLGSELLRRGLDVRMWYYGVKTENIRKMLHTGDIMFRSLST